jgi:hypothetical protein
VLKVEKIWGLNLPETPRVTSACRGTLLLLYPPVARFQYLPKKIISKESVVDLKDRKSHLARNLKK